MGKILPTLPDIRLKFICVLAADIDGLIAQDADNSTEICHWEFVVKQFTTMFLLESIIQEHPCYLPSFISLFESTNIGDNIDFWREIKAEKMFVDLFYNSQFECFMLFQLCKSNSEFVVLENVDKQYITSIIFLLQSIKYLIHTVGNLGAFISRKNNPSLSCLCFVNTRYSVQSHSKLVWSKVTIPIIIQNLQTNLNINKIKTMNFKNFLTIGSWILKTYILNV